MRHAAALLAVIVVGVAVAAAAAAALRDPSAMILRQADIASNATYEADDDLDEYLKTPLKAAGLSGLVATYFGAKFSEQKGSVKVSGIVLTVASPAEARKVFAITNRARDRITRRVASQWTTVSLPSYGDQQRALIDPPGEEGIAIAELVVRKRTTVWFLHLTLERRPKPPVAELVADLKRFATKQKQRVGTG
jgi:hypothetical protein